MKDQRLAALEEHLGKMLLRAKREQEEILQALETERDIQQKAEADLKAVNKEPPKILRFLMRGRSRAKEVQPPQDLQTPSAQEQCLIKQLVQLALDNTALKQQIADNAIKEEAEKSKIMEALRKERALRKEERAANKVINKKLEDENKTLKESVAANLEEIKSVKRQADEAQDESKKSFNLITALEEKLNKVAQELSDVVTKTTSEKAVLQTKLKNAESEAVQGEAVYKLKLAAMEQRMTARTKWLEKTDDKIQDMEEYIKHLEEKQLDLQVSNIELRVINRDLEELVQGTDKTKEEAEEGRGEKCKGGGREGEKREVPRESHGVAGKTEGGEKAVLQTKLKNAESEAVQVEAVYKIKLAAIEQRMTARTKWLDKMDDKCKDMEEYIKHLEEQQLDLQVSNIELRVINRDLEELAQGTDKRK